MGPRSGNGSVESSLVRKSPVSLRFQLRVRVPGFLFFFILLFCGNGSFCVGPPRPRPFSARRPHRLKARCSLSVFLVPYGPWPMLPPGSEGPAPGRPLLVPLRLPLVCRSLSRGPYPATETGTQAHLAVVVSSPSGCSSPWSLRSGVPVTEPGPPSRNHSVPRRGPGLRAGDTSAPLS